MSKNRRTIHFFKKKSFIIACAIFIIAIGVLRFGFFHAEQDTISNHVTFTVQRGPLMISVIESGTIKARDQVIIKNEVEGKTSILYLIPEGTLAKKGDLLVELDASGLMDNKIDQQIKVQNADAAFVGARENLAVVENQAQSDVDKAELAYTFAKEDLKKYLEGEFPNELKEAESRLTLATEEVARAKENLEWSKKLADEKYISQTELEADELTVKKKSLDVELAQNNLDLLKNFTHKRMLAQLKSDVKQAEMALERTIRKAKADVVQAQANLAARKAEYERQKDKLNKIQVQIEKTKIYAPADGLVIHATSAQGGHPRRRVEPLEEGQAVMERQELIHLPTTAAAKAEVSIHEASLDKIQLGLPVKITVDALPGETFVGRVAKIAPLPDARSAWLNPDLKVYDTDIYLENNSTALKTGMSCNAEIIVEQHREATYIPVQAVLRVGRQPTVYLVNGKNLEPRKVEIGLDNGRMVRIISGLEPGEVVSLTPPLAPAAVEAETDTIIAEIGPKKIDTKPASETLNKPLQPSYSDAENLTSAEREKIRERLQSMPPEEKEKIRAFFKSMTPEQKKRFKNMSSEEKKKRLRQIMERQQ